jgi:hypothetical protein
MAKRLANMLTIPVGPELAQRLYELARAERRTRTDFVLLHLEKLAQQGPQELPEERAA